MILSFAWTWPAFVAGAKTVTRRDWKSNYAQRWLRDTRFDAYDRSPRFGGHKIGEGVLVADARLEPLADMPDDDYADEGFEFLHTYPGLLPRSARDNLWGKCTQRAFEDWRNSGDHLYVVRFRVLSIADRARRALEQKMADDRLIRRPLRPARLI